MTQQNPLYQQLFVLEMANNHQGSVEHGKRVISEMKAVCDTFPFRFAFKLQYRNLKSFIHPDYRDREDIKYVKRFRDTELEEAQLLELKTAIEDAGFTSMCTPFDEDSVDWIEQHGFDMLKIASCSLTDWPLLERIAQSSLPLVASTAGATMEDIENVVQFFLHRHKSLAVMHCVGEYPTPRENLQLGQIKLLQQRFPEVPIGYSTHEDPNETEAVKMAIALGAQLFEKHVGVGELNAYSANPEQVRNWLLSAQQGFAMMGFDGQRVPVTETELTTLNSLRRAVFAKSDLKPGQALQAEHFYLAIPSQPGQLLANDLSKYKQFELTQPIKANQPIMFDSLTVSDIRPKVFDALGKVCALLRDASITVADGVNCQLSHHYGIDAFEQTGATIIDVVNREYCKKILVLLPGQQHPVHAHHKKEETFNVLFGEMQLQLGDELKTIKAGDMVTVERGMQHAFSSEQGVIFEELSTTHYNDDSFYQDKSINQNSRRKTNLIFRSDWLTSEW
jgi:sialic acid synthase SpsE/mannose-6-phosphate isomerase-like protein (cupin superfamily)